MIELAPHHKYGLPLKSPVMTASGAVGYGDEYADLIDYSFLGALVTNPVSLRPRKASHGTRLRIHGEHLVVHTGLPNPGVKAIVHKYETIWERLSVPVIVHLLATTPTETAKAAIYLSGITGVVGIELGLADNTEADRAATLVHSALEGVLPVIVRIPFRNVDELTPVLAEEGASALTLTAPPRVVLPPEQIEDRNSLRFYRGRLYGPAVYPILLNSLTRWARKVSVPVIACGGIQSAEQALACLHLGATAVQIDSVLWRHPTLLPTIIHELTDLINSLTLKTNAKEEVIDDENMARSSDNFSDLLFGT
jgi:dihydroorotate dehydrogenase (NAD+) catalytic subunit